MFKTFYFSAKLVVVMSLFVFDMPASLAQSNLSAPQNPERFLKFTTAVAALSEKTQQAILCEDEPLHCDISDKNKKTFLDALGKQGLSPDDLVSFVANAYDYQAVRTGKSIWIFLKKYSSPDDLPYLTLEETEIRLRHILDACQNYKPDFDLQGVINDLTASFNEKQAKEVAEGVTPRSLIPVEKDAEAGLPVSDMSPAQQGFVRRFVIHHGFGAMETLSALSRRMTGSLAQKTTLQRELYYGLSFPVYTGPMGFNKTNLSVVLGYWYRSEVGGAILFETGTESPLVNPTSTTPLFTHNKPEPSSLPDPYLRQRGSKITQTLGELVKSLPSHPNWKNSPYKEVKIDAALEAKPVYAVGTRFATVEELVPALAKVHELDVRLQVGVARIALPAAAQPWNDPAKVADEVRRQIPGSFWRLVAAARERAGKDIAPSTLPEEVKARLAVDSTLFVRQTQANQKAIDALYLVAVRRLRTLIEPKIDKHVDRKMPLSEATDEARGLIALSSLLLAADNLQSLLRPVPGYVNYFEQGRLSLKHGKGPHSYTYSFVSSNPQGQRSGISGKHNWSPLA